MADFIGAMFKVVTDVKKVADDQAAFVNSCMRTALKKSTYEFTQSGKRAVKTGTLGLRPFKPYWKRGYFNPRTNKYVPETRFKDPVRSGPGALSALVSDPKYGKSGLTYSVDPERLMAKVGFLEPGMTMDTKTAQETGEERKSHAPGAWQARIAEKSVAGYKIMFTKAEKDYLHRQGIHVRAATESSTVPGRDIMGRIRDRFEVKFYESFRQFFKMKLNGERI